MSLAMEIQFCKIVEGEKDFVIIDYRDGLCDRMISEELVIGLCDRLHGIGASAVLFVENAARGNGLSCRIIGADLSFEALHSFALFASALGEDALAQSLSFESAWGDIKAVFSEEGEVSLSLAEESSKGSSGSIGAPEFIYSGVIDL